MSLMISLVPFPIMIASKSVNITHIPQMRSLLFVIPDWLLFPFTEDKFLLL